MTLAAGTRLDSSEIVAPINWGGIGEVYRARDTAVMRDLAIRRFQDYWSRNPIGFTASSPSPLPRSTPNSSLKHFFSGLFGRV